jgi:hypothetical protein
MKEDRWLVWLEVASVLVILGVVVALAVPKSGEVKRARTAQELLADVESMRRAVYRFYSDSAYFPVQVPGQQVPDGLRPYLPRGFTLARAYGTLDYRNWPMAVQDTLVTRAPNVVGVTVTVADPRIGAAAASRTQEVARFVVGNKYTFLFFGS